jgi:hypothetical protein
MSILMSIRHILRPLASFALVVSFCNSPALAQDPPAPNPDPFTLPDDAGNGPGASVVIHTNTGSGNVMVTMTATGTDQSYQMPVQKFEDGRWEDVGGPIEVTPGNVGSVTIGSNQRVLAADVDTGGDKDDVTGTVTKVAA